MPSVRHSALSNRQLEQLYGLARWRLWCCVYPSSQAGSGEFGSADRARRWPRRATIGNWRSWWRRINRRRGRYAAPSCCRMLRPPDAGRRRLPHQPEMYAVAGEVPSADAQRGACRRRVSYNSMARPSGLLTPTGPAWSGGQRVPDRLRSPTTAASFDGNLSCYRGVLMSCTGRLGHL